MHMRFQASLIIGNTLIRAYIIGLLLCVAKFWNSIKVTLMFDDGEFTVSQLKLNNIVWT